MIKRNHVGVIQPSLMALAAKTKAPAPAIVPSSPVLTKQTGSPTYAAAKILVPVSVNGHGIKIQFDTGAQVSSLTAATAASVGVSTANATQFLNVTGVSGGAVRTPVVTIQMSIMGAAYQPIQVEVGGNFDLLSYKDLTVNFDAVITGSGVQFKAKGSNASSISAAGNNLFTGIKSNKYIVFALIGILVLMVLIVH